MTVIDPTGGDPAAIRRAARWHEERADQCRTQFRAVASLLGALGPHEWTGHARRRFDTAADTMAPAFSRIAGLCDATAEVLHAYADDVEEIQDEARRIRSAMDRAASDHHRLTGARHGMEARLTSGENVEYCAAALRGIADELTSVEHLRLGLDAAWDDLVVRRQRADRVAAAELSDAGTLGVLASVSGSVTVSDARFLQFLGGLGPDEIAALRDDEEFADRLAALDPEDVAAWWDSLGGKGTAGSHSPVQDAWIAAFPAVIGNLNGVPYWARNAANVITLQRELRRAEGGDLAAYRDILRSLKKKGSVMLVSLPPRSPSPRRRGSRRPRHGPERHLRRTRHGNDHP